MFVSYLVNGSSFGKRKRDDYDRGPFLVESGIELEEVGFLK